MNVVAHLDEIFLKGNNQRIFIRQLSNNLRALLPGVEVRRTESGSLWLENITEEYFERLAKIPGLAKIAPAVTSDLKIEAIKQAVAGFSFSNDIKTFRVTATRANKKYPMPSSEVEKIIGAYIVQIRGWKVDLVNFDLNLRVEIGEKLAKIYGNTTWGAGGLPTGISGKILCLLSGGIDSPVAAYEMMKRGAEIELIHFQNQTQVTEEVSQKIFDLAKTLAVFQPRIKLNIVPFGDWQRQIVMKIPADYRMLITRRLMFKYAENYAQKENILALCTGDSLGQVASQTLENLSAVYNSVNMLKLTPLISYNKTEIVKIAKKIKTLGISERPYEDCCSLFVAKHPQTRARLKNVLKIEKALDLTELDKTPFISYYISI